MMPDLMPDSGLRIGLGGAARLVSRVRGGGLFFPAALTYTDGSIEIDHANKGRFLNESSRGLFADYMKNRGYYYGY